MRTFLDTLFSPKVSPPQITSEEVMSYLEQKKPFILIDVRTPFELTRGKIPGCRNIPLDELESRIQQEIPDKEQKVILYCLSGTRSDKGVSMMARLGYTDVYSMTSGMLMWRYKKYPII